MAVFVLDKHKKPLMPCSEKRARLLLGRGRARIHKMLPFTIRLADRTAKASTLQPVRLKLDPGSKTTGVALSREGTTPQDQTVLALIEIEHRGTRIRDALKQRSAQRRQRRLNLRYRPIRYSNRPKPKGWLPPSLQHRVDTTRSWAERLMGSIPITAIDHELVKFDTQVMQNPDIDDVGYQQGSLFKYEVREYCLEKWNRTCMYCDARDVPLQLEHIVPRSKGGSNRPSNLGIACAPCNQAKGNLALEKFVKDAKRLKKIRAHMKRPLHDAAAVNNTRLAQLAMLKTFGLPVSTASGGKTKMNRTLLGVPKAHALDAACVGDITSIAGWRKASTTTIRCDGRGAYKRTRLTKHGFPRGYLMRTKSIFGFSTGDMVVATIPAGMKAGVHRGRVAIRASGRFDVRTPAGIVAGLAHKHMRLIQRGDGYGYAVTMPTKTGRTNLKTVSSARKATR